MKTKFYARDVIGLVALVFCFILIGMGINHLVSGIAIMIITFYFARRVEGEGDPKKDINERIGKVEDQTQQNTHNIKTINKNHPKPLPPGEVIVKPAIF